MKFKKNTEWQPQVIIMILNNTAIKGIHVVVKNNDFKLLQYADDIIL